MFLTPKQEQSPKSEGRLTAINIYTESLSILGILCKKQDN